MRCQRCFGTGVYMGPGMMMKDCYCDDIEDVKVKAPESIQIDKRSKAYRDAIAKIMQENKLSKSEATEMFEQEFKKLA